MKLKYMMKWIYKTMPMRATMFKEIERYISQSSKVKEELNKSLNKNTLLSIMM